MVPSPTNTGLCGVDTASAITHGISANAMPLTELIQVQQVAVGFGSRSGARREQGRLGPWSPGGDTTFYQLEHLKVLRATLQVAHFD